MQVRRPSWSELVLGCLMFSVVAAAFLALVVGIIQILWATPFLLVIAFASAVLLTCLIASSG